jgi:hypothetical protein
MAILRGGRRIGNYDIRVGLPRDRSLDNVAGDARLKQRQGNPESTIGRFMANIAQGEGFARPTRYLVRIFIPSKLQIDRFSADRFSNDGQEGIINADGINRLGGQELARNVGMMCDSISMPSRNVASEAHQIYGPKREMPYAYTFPGTVEASFYGDKFLRQRAFFETWQKLIFNINTHNLNYYDEYTSEIDIYQLGQSTTGADRDRITYGVRLYEVYPKTMGSIEYSYGADDIVKVPVTLAYRYWRNLTLDQMGNATIGSSFGKIPEVKLSNDFGVFGGILNKLPPELKRVGRDVINQTRRNLPTGRITGGRVFPPFL